MCLSNFDVQNFTKINIEDHNGILDGSWVILLFRVSTIPVCLFVYLFVFGATAPIGPGPPHS